MITAQLTTVRADRMVSQHAIDAGRVAAIAAVLEAADAYTLPPVLVLEDEGNGYELLDGHHRARAARQWQSDARIPAYVVPVAEYCAVLDEHFNGESPTRLTDLDPYILIDGAPYAGR